MKKSMKIEEKNKGNIRKMIFGIFVNIILITSIFLLLSGDDGEVRQRWEASASTESEIILDPAQYQYLTLNNEGDALSETIAQIEMMEYGNVNTLYPNEVASYNLILDNTIGGVIYWMFNGISDSEDVTICINANTEEIVIYSETGIGLDPPMPDPSVENEMTQIASQFAMLPQDKSPPPLVPKIRHAFTFETTEGDTTSYDYWVGKWDRVKNNIITEDHIIIWLSPNGDLSYYEKSWNMDLQEFSTEYSVSLQDATDYVTETLFDGIPIYFLDDPYKKIIRPNGFFNDESLEWTYGTPPTCVWVFEIASTDDIDDATYYGFNGTLYTLCVNGMNPDSLLGGNARFIPIGPGPDYNETDIDMTYADEDW